MLVSHLVVLHISMAFVIATLSLKVVLVQNFTLQPFKSGSNIKEAIEQASSSLNKLLIVNTPKDYRSKIRNHVGDEYI